MRALVAAALIVWAGAAVAHDGHIHRPVPQSAVAPAGEARPASLAFDFGGPFSLIDQDGKRRTDQDFHGRYMLVFFGYAQCRSICPVGLGRMAQALDSLGAVADRIQPVFITVDPDNDTPKTLGAFVHKIHPRMIGLTGSRAEVRAVERAYNVDAKRLTAPGDAEPIYAHGSFIFLMKPDGKFDTLFPPVMGAEAMAASIRRYVE